jgi:hypothetical protein
VPQEGVEPQSDALLDLFGNRELGVEMFSEHALHHPVRHGAEKQRAGGDDREIARPEARPVAQAPAQGAREKPLERAR